VSTDLVPFDPTLFRAMQACVDHARHLAGSARLVHEAGRHNIAYHLAILALEELGRRELIAIKTIKQSGDRPDRLSQDHVQKLFWCFFGGQFGTERLTKESIETMQGFARRLHEKRLTALYVDYGSDGLTVPAEQVSPDDAVRIVELAEARLALSESETLRDGKTPEDIALQRWFLGASSDVEKRKFIFSARSLDQLASLANARAWVQWIKGEFDRIDAENQALAEREIERGRTLSPTTSGRDKWKVRIRLYSASHSIRPKALRDWNEKVTWLKLIPVPDKKDQLLLEIHLKEDVPIQSLWFFAWGVARHFVTALNIATMGYWFWRLPVQVSRYYESIEDILERRQLVVERQPPLKIDWGENRVLTSAELSNLISTFVCIPGPADSDRHAPYNFYMGGLTFLSLNDIHWQCESTVLGNFFESLRAMMALAGHWKEGSSFAAAFGSYLSEAFPDMDEDRERMLSLCSAFESGTLKAEVVTLKEASFSKLFCDAYFLHKVRPQELARRQAESGANSPSYSDPPS
jgi:AbiV family abortive infection protein